MPRKGLHVELSLQRLTGKTRVCGYLIGRRAIGACPLSLRDYFRHRRGCTGISRRLVVRMFINLPVKVAGDKVGPCDSSHKILLTGSKTRGSALICSGTDQDCAANYTGHLILRGETDLPLKPLHLAKVIGE